MAVVIFTLMIIVWKICLKFIIQNLIMKIRIKGNSIRLRLTKTDVADLKEKGMVSEKTVFESETIFHYSLYVDADSKEINAKFSDQTIEIFLPEKEAKILIDTEQITIENSQYNGEKDQLFLLIEKDLQCLDSTSEDQSDMYENTKTQC